MHLPSYAGEPNNAKAQRSRLTFSKPTILVVAVTVGVAFLVVEVGLRIVNYGAPPELVTVTLSDGEVLELPFPLEDPYSAPGHLQFDLAKPLDTRWVPFNTPEKTWRETPAWSDIFRLAGNLPYPQDPKWNGAAPYFTFDPETAKYPLDELPPSQREATRQKNLAMIPHLRNTTILLLGDSIDRNTVDQWAWLYQVAAVKDSFDGSPFDGGDPHTWGYPHVLRIEGDIGLTIANGFFYGSMDDENDFSFTEDWIPPGNAEERVTKLFKPLADRLDHPPSLIQFHSGMWDLAYLGRQDKATGTDTNTPLTDERIAKWMKRVSLTIQRVKKTWPGVPIVFRKIHRVGTSGSAGAADWQGGQIHQVNYFTDIRFHQIRHLQDVVAAKEGIAVWDFGEIFEGFQMHQDKVHPTMWPGSTVMWNGLMHHAYLAKYQQDYNRPPMKAGRPAVPADVCSQPGATEVLSASEAEEGWGHSVVEHSKVAQLMGSMMPWK